VCTLVPAKQPTNEAEHGFASNENAKGAAIPPAVPFKRGVPTVAQEIFVAVADAVHVASGHPWMPGPQREGRVDIGKRLRNSGDPTDLQIARTGLPFSSTALLL
jgi:hypothetical protein